MFRKLLLLATLIPYQQLRPPYNSPINNVTFAELQANPLLCRSSNGTGTYECTINDGPAGYSFGMTFSLWVDTPTYIPTVSINSLPSIAIDDAATGTTPAPVTANAPHVIFFDGTVFRLMI